MDPIRATQDAIEEHGPFTLNGKDLLPQLYVLSEEVKHRVPSLFGLSLSLLDLDATFTFMATSQEVAVLDALQYVDGGPCVTAIADGELLAHTTGRDGGDEDPWPLFSRASAVNGVACTLSLPLLRQGQTVGGFNLYAGTVGAFDGRHEELASVLGAWSGGAVADADLSFGSRLLAERAPAILRGATDQVIARRLLELARGIDRDEADERLRSAAVRANITLTLLAETVIRLLGRR